MSLLVWLAKFTPDLKSYGKKPFLADLSAGIVVGIVALPLSMALAISVGVNPVVGLYTAGIAGLAAAVFAGAAYNVTGPAAAMVPILAGIYESFGKDFAKLQYVGFLAGLILLVMGLLKIGRLIKYIPHAVTVGFTFGVAVVIFAGQLPAFLGLTGLGHYEKFHAKTLDMFAHVGTAHLPTLIIGLLAIAIILYSQKIKPLKRIPSTLLAVSTATLLVKYVGAFHSVKTISDKFGNIPAGIPLPTIGIIQNNVQHTGDMLVPAIKIAFLIGIETLLCAVVADKLTSTKHRSNQELAAQGVGNMLSPLFGGFASTAVIARTGTIVKSGAQSRIAAIIHALIVLVFVIILSPLAGMLPLSALSAILLVTAWRISEQKEIRQIFGGDANTIKITLLITALLTIFEDLVIGVGAGVAFFYAARFVSHQRFKHGEQYDEDIISDADELEEAGVDEGTNKRLDFARLRKLRARMIRKR